MAENFNSCDQQANTIEDRLRYLEQCIKELRTSNNEEAKSASEYHASDHEARQETSFDQEHVFPKLVWELDHDGADKQALEEANETWTEDELTAFYATECEPTVKRVSWSSYKTKYNRYNKNSFAIIVPTGELQTSIQHHAHDRVNNTSAGLIASPLAPLFQPSAKQRPSRIRINSPQMQHELADVAGFSISLASVDYTILSPFKPLLCNEQKIRLRLQSLIQTAGSMVEAVSQTIADGLHDKEMTEAHTVKFDELGEQSSDDTATNAQGSEQVDPPGTPSSLLSGHDSLADVTDIADVKPISLEFEALKKIAKAKSVLPHWQCLVDFMDTDLKYLLDLRLQIQSGSLQTIEFEDLWHLFEPGRVVIRGGSNRLQGLRVLQVSGGRRLLSAEVEMDSLDTTATKVLSRALTEVYRPKESHSPLKVSCYHVDFDGKTYGPSQYDFTIQKYSGPRDVCSLAVYPIQFLESRSNAIQSPWNILRARGQHFCELSVPDTIPHKQYRGQSLDEPKEEIDGPVIVDCTLASVLSPKAELDPEVRRSDQQWTPQLGLRALPDFDDRETTELNEFDIPAKVGDDWDVERTRTRDFISEKAALLLGHPVQAVTADVLEDDDLITLPYKLYVFVLNSRKWSCVDIDNITDLEYAGDNFSKLVLPEGHDKIVKSLVENHLNTRNQELLGEKRGAQHADLVRGKGKGLIILLHGAPGVGKTSTAECIADYTKRPLFPLTCGDIGETAKDVEENLELTFRLAHRWNCVLLLDEADVFLAKREKTDLRRNALVSVFLRVLEYYAGILFLTTNRIGAFDEAFKSRIHMSLYYPPLDKEKTVRVWETNIEQVEKSNRGMTVELNAKELIKFAKSHYDQFDSSDDESLGRRGRWNGRQIRNAFQTAIALAVWDSKGRNNQSGNQATLRREHFEQVALASLQFDQYLNEVYGGVDEANAEGLREDNFRPTPPRKSSWSVKKKSAQTNTHKKSRRKDVASESEDKRGPKGKGRRMSPVEDDTESSVQDRRGSKSAAVRSSSEDRNTKKGKKTKKAFTEAAESSSDEARTRPREGRR